MYRSLYPGTNNGQGDWIGRRDGNQRPAQEPRKKCEPEQRMKRQRAGSDFGQKHEEQTDKSIEKTTQAHGKLAWIIHRRLCVKTWTIIGWRKPENSSSGNRSKEQCYRAVLPYQCLALNCFSAFFHSPQITMDSANSVSCFLSISSPFKGGF